MENASKALIMAGAILISIILISISLVVINSTKGLTDQGKAATDLVAVAAHNSQFNQYAGTQKGSQVRNLLIQVNTYNNMDSDTSNNVTVEGVTLATVKINAKYVVTIEENYANGYISKMKVVESP